MLYFINVNNSLCITSANSFNKNTIRFFVTTKPSVNNKLQKKVMKTMNIKTALTKSQKNLNIFTFNKDKYQTVLKNMNMIVDKVSQTRENQASMVNNNNKETISFKPVVNKQSKLLNKVTYALLSPVNKNTNFKFFLGSLMYWSVPFNYTVTSKFFLEKKDEQKNVLSSHLQYNSEMLLRYTKRNAQVIIHMPRVPGLVFKKFLLHREVVRQWNKNNSSDMLFGFGTGDCGFKPNETKTFTAKDTLIRAGLWVITRFVKKLSPIKLRFHGDTRVFRQYLNRLTPKTKKFKYFVAHIEDSTPISFNGCKLRHAPRKRFRYHTNNFKNVVTYIKYFKELKPQGMVSYKKSF